MRRILKDVTTKLSTGTTLRLLRCRDESLPKQERRKLDKGEKADESQLYISRTKNELVASLYDTEKQKYRDFIRMTVADTLPEAMPEFLTRSRAEIERLLPRFDGVNKVSRTDCQTVGSFTEFAEALQRR